MGEAATTGKAPASILTWLAIAAGGIVLSWPAFWNGYPLLFTDSASFIGGLNPWGQHWARPIFYSWALWPLHWGLTLWPVVLAQGILLAHLMWLLLRTTVGRVALPAYAVAVLLVAAGSALPWYTSQIMPDVLTPVLVVSIFLLGFAGDRLGRRETLWLTLLLAGAVAVHLSHMPLAAGLLTGVLAIRLLRDGAASLTAAAPVAVALLVAVGAHVALNLAVVGKASLSPFGSIFLLARSQADGPAARFLREECPAAGWRLCAEADRLPVHADTFLWDRQGPLWRAAGLAEPVRQQAGGMRYQAEAAEILSGTLARHGAEQFRAVVANTAAQIGMARTGDGLLPWSEAEGVSRAVRGELGWKRDYAAYRASRQIAGTLGLDAVNRVHGWVLLLAALVAVGIALAEPPKSDFRVLLAIIALTLLGNALIAGGLSGPHDRYQARVACLIVVACGVGLALAAARRAERVRPAARPVDEKAAIAI